MNEKTKDILEWIFCIVVAVVLALFVRYFVGTPTIVKQPSMFPTLKENQRLILSRVGRTMKKLPERGDIITFEAPSEIYTTEENYNNSYPVAEYNNKHSGFGKFVYNFLEIGKVSYIKRVIALPGEHVEIKDGGVYINGSKLEENYLQPGVVTDSLGGVYTDFTVPENCVFAMGDNRPQSTDCRRFGCIPLEKIEGKVKLRIWPLNLFGKVD
mgnify:CR=1 FL=1